LRLSHCPSPATTYTTSSAIGCGTPVNGYLGSGYYGQDIKAMLQQPLSAGAADGVVDKLHEDIAVLDALPPNSTNIYQVDNGIDRLDLVLEVAGRIVPINQTEL
jgi:hypothetical protein